MGWPGGGGDEAEPPIEPSSFDLVVVGTGLVETLVAAAAAKAGRSVLNLDPEGRYGSAWAGMDLGAMGRWAVSLPPGPDASAEAAGCYGGSCFVEEGADLGGTDRQFILDLAAPKLALSAGPLVETIVRSGAHHYLEFKHLDGSYMLGEDGGLQRVPASRADVFKDKTLSLAEKRVLMRFLKASLERVQGEDEGGGGGGGGAAAGAPPPEGTFASWLESEGLPPRLRAVVSCAIALCESPPSSYAASEGLGRLKSYLGSIDRYGQGQGALLFPYYGASELPQAFSRVAAVAGTVQVLRRPVESVVMMGGEEGQGGQRVAAVVTSTGQRIACGALAVGAHLAPALLPPPPAATPSSPARAVARAVCVLDGPLVPGTGQALVVIPPPSSLSSPSSPAAAVHALQVGAGGAVCPAGRWVLYLATAGAPPGGGGDAEATLRPVLDSLLSAAASAAAAEGGGGEGPAEGGTGPGDEAGGNREEGDGAHITAAAGKPPGPKLLWAAFYFQQATRAGGEGGAEGAGGAGATPPNAVACAAPDASATFGSAVGAAEAALARLFPGEAFLPAPPEGAATAGQDSDSDEDNAILAAAAAATAVASSAPAAAGAGAGQH